MYTLFPLAMRITSKLRVWAKCPSRISNMGESADGLVLSMKCEQIVLYPTRWVTNPYGPWRAPFISWLLQFILGKIIIGGTKVPPALIQIMTQENLSRLQLRLRFGAFLYDQQLLHILLHIQAICIFTYSYAKMMYWQTTNDEPEQALNQTNFNLLDQSKACNPPTILILPKVGNEKRNESRGEGGRVENHIGKNTLNTSKQDSNPDFPVICILAYCECDAIEHTAIEA
ncbi:unnamed protein product, partial [Timema podura]|nr:unnamed protein product [Timema podura]